MYEMAQRLRAAGEAVSQLGLIDSRAHNASARPLYRNSAYGQMARKDWLSDDAVMLGILFPSLAMDWEPLCGPLPTSTGCTRWSRCQATITA